MKSVRSAVTAGDIYNTEICGFYPGSDVTCHIAASTSAGSSPNATTNVTLPCKGMLCFIAKILSKVATVMVNSLRPNFLVRFNAHQVVKSQHFGLNHCIRHTEKPPSCENGKDRSIKGRKMLTLPVWPVLLIGRSAVPIFYSTVIFLTNLFNAELHSIPLSVLF